MHDVVLSALTHVSAAHTSSHRLHLHHAQLHHVRLHHGKDAQSGNKKSSSGRNTGPTPREEQFSTLSIVALTSGSLTMIFFVVCVEQLTNFSRELHGANKSPRPDGTRFYSCKYLFALIALSLSSSALIADGVIALMRRADLAPWWLDMAPRTGVGIIEAASWSFALMIFVIASLEFRLRYVVDSTSSAFEEPDDGGTSLRRWVKRRVSQLHDLPARMLTAVVRILTSSPFGADGESQRASGDQGQHDDQGRFERQRKVIQWALYLVLSGVTAVFVVLLSLRCAKIIPTREAYIIVPFAAATAIVLGSAVTSGLAALFFLHDCAFVIVSDVDEVSGRRYLLARQTHEPHPNKWIFPGGMMERGRGEDALAYVKKKLDDSPISTSIGNIVPIHSYCHLMPEEGVAYKGKLFHAPITNRKCLEALTEGFQMFTLAEMTDQDVPPLVQAQARWFDERHMLWITPEADQAVPPQRGAERRSRGLR